MIEVIETTRRLCEMRIPQGTRSGSIYGPIAGIPGNARLIDVDECDGRFILVFEWEDSE